MARRKTTQTTDDQTTGTTGAPADTGTSNADAPAPATARRGRRPRIDTTSSNATESATAETVADTETAPETAPATPAAEQPRQQQQRRRRRNTIDTAAEASVLIAAMLRHRGGVGASQDELPQVVAWGRSTRAEGQELQRAQKGPGSSGRTRRPSEETIARAQRSFYSS